MSFLSDLATIVSDASSADVMQCVGPPKNLIFFADNILWRKHLYFWQFTTHMFKRITPDELRAVKQFEGDEMGLMRATMWVKKRSLADLALLPKLVNAPNDEDYKRLGCVRSTWWRKALAVLVALRSRDEEIDPDSTYALLAEQADQDNMVVSVRALPGGGEELVLEGEDAGAAESTGENLLLRNRVQPAKIWDRDFNKEETLMDLRGTYADARTASMIGLSGEKITGAMFQGATQADERVAKYTAVQLRGGPRGVAEAGVQLTREKTLVLDKAEQLVVAWEEKWSTDPSFIATLTREKILEELELHKDRQFFLSKKVPLEVYEPNWRVVPGTKKPALKPQLAALLAKVRVQTQKLRSSEFKPPPKPQVASQKSQKVAKATGETKDVLKLREHRFYSNLCE